MTTIACAAVCEYTHSPARAGATRNGKIEPCSRSDQAMEAMKSRLADGNVCRLVVATRTRKLPTMANAATVMMAAGSAGNLAEEDTASDALVVKDAFEKFIFQISLSSLGV